MKTIHTVHEAFVALCECAAVTAANKSHHPTIWGQTPSGRSWVPGARFVSFDQHKFWSFFPEFCAVRMQALGERLPTNKLNSNPNPSAERLKPPTKVATNKRSRNRTELSICICICACACVFRICDRYSMCACDCACVCVCICIRRIARIDWALLVGLGISARLAKISVVLLAAWRLPRDWNWLESVSIKQTASYPGDQQSKLRIHLLLLKTNIYG